jgi:hypothetical protein
MRPRTWIARGSLGTDKAAYPVELMFANLHARHVNRVEGYLRHPRDSERHPHGRVCEEAICDLLGRALLRSRPDMPEFRDVDRCGGLYPELRQKLVVVEFVGGADRCSLRAREKPLMVEGLKYATAVGLLANAIEAHGIQPLEDVAVFPVLRGTAMLLDETLNLLKACDDTLFARRPARVFLRLDLDAKLVEKGIVLFGEPSHARPPFMRARKATPSAIRFSQASGDVIEGSLPRSCLNFKARLASSRASSIVRLIRLAAITASTCFRLSSLIVLARMA